MDTISYIFVHLICSILSFELIRSFYYWQNYELEWEENRFIFVPAIVFLGLFALVGIGFWILSCLVWLVAKTCIETRRNRKYVSKTFG